MSTRRRFTDEDLTKECEREARMRRSVYARQQEGKELTPTQSQRIAMMEELAEILREGCNEQPDMLGDG